MKKKEIKIIIVDDHQLFVDGLKRIIEDIKNYKVIKTCNNWEELRLMLNAEIPDLIMLDIQMKGINGLEICKLIKETHPFIKVIFISMLETSLVIEEGKKVGANGFIPKTTDAALVKKTIENVLNNIDSYINLTRVNEEVNTNKSQLNLITKREKEIIQLIKAGDNTALIAKKLFISKYTVDTHRKNILRKLQLSSIKELIAFAYENYY
ncbi:MAG: response regulator transcription factor [Polaribacter sp.]|nr:response regulator transcription factor [Polaribacter sp.]